MGSNYCAARGQRWQRSHRLKPAPRPLVVASNLNPSTHQASSRFGERVEKNWAPFADPTGNLLVHRFLDDANGDAVAQTVVQGGEISSRASRTEPDPAFSFRCPGVGAALRGHFGGVTAEEMPLSGGTNGVRISASHLIAVGHAKTLGSHPRVYACFAYLFQATAPYCPIAATPLFTLYNGTRLPAAHADGPRKTPLHSLAKDSAQHIIFPTSLVLLSNSLGSPVLQLTRGDGRADTSSYQSTMPLEHDARVPSHTKSEASPRMFKARERRVS